MTIVAPELPPRTREAMRRGLIASGRPARDRRASVSLSLPHPVFAAGLEPLAAGRHLHETAEAVGWRALVELDEVVVAAAEVPLSGDVPATITQGPVVASTVEALVTADRDERVAAGSFDVRLLRIHGLNVSALWLDRSAPEDAVFIVLAP